MVLDTEIVEIKDDNTVKVWEKYHNSGMEDLIGKYHLCKVLFSLYKLGLINRFKESGCLDVSNAKIDGLDSYLLENLFLYLIFYDILKKEDNKYYLTDLGKLLLEDVSIAQLGFYVEAYGEITSKISSLISGEDVYGENINRDGEALGKHCATLFHQFHTSTVLYALQNIKASYILDLGCGGGQFLIDACLRDQNLRGIGLDISKSAIEFACTQSDKNGLSNRLKFVVGNAFSPDTWPKVCYEADVLCATGVLHEHFRDGESAVINLLNTFASIFKRNHYKAFILGEPELYYDNKDNDLDLFLVHIFTKQGFPRNYKEWLKLFEKTNFQCRKVFRRSNAGPRFSFFDLIPV